MWGCFIIINAMFFVVLFATSLALYLSRLLFALSFTSITHSDPLAFLLSGKGTISHVLFCYKAKIYFSRTTFHEGSIITSSLIFVSLCLIWSTVACKAWYWTSPHQWALVDYRYNHPKYIRVFVYLWLFLGASCLCLDALSIV